MNFMSDNRVGYMSLMPMGMDRDFLDCADVKTVWSLPDGSRTVSQAAYRIAVERLFGLKEGISVAARKLGKRLAFHRAGRRLWQTPTSKEQLELENLRRRRAVRSLGFQSCTTSLASLGTCHAGRSQ